MAGHTLGMAAALWAMLLPPVAWTGGSAWREAAVFGSLAAGALLGAAVTGGSWDRARASSR